MEYKIIEINIDDMQKYAAVPISFNVKSILEPVQIDKGIGGIKFVEREVIPYIKNNDEFGSGAVNWHKRFDTSNWVRFAVIDKEKNFIGGATVAYNTENVNMLEGRIDITVLWDLRVHPKYRGIGIGRALIDKVAEWSKSKDCVMIKIETQNSNVRACRFYSAMGCRLGGIKMHNYKEKGLENEIMLFWYLDL